jgi:hypothetical protein
MSFSATRTLAQASILFSLDTTPVRFQYGHPYVWDTVHGSIQNLTADSTYFSFKRTLPPQWIITTQIAVPRLDNIGIGPHEVLPVLIGIMPYPEHPDTESECFTLISLPDSAVQEHCIPLYLDAPSGVAEEPFPSNPSGFYPNPFGSSSTLVLTPEQAVKKVTVKIYDAAGREMTSRFNIRISSDSVLIERRNAPSGSYYYRLLSKVSSQPSGIIGAGHFVVQ